MSHRNLVDCISFIQNKKEKKFLFPFVAHSTNHCNCSSFWLSSYYPALGSLWPKVNDKTPLHLLDVGIP
uniref:Uncharacterized protein n=1 Tax=Rhizophora mucronata TaxID=61149 RepID=A0A2P2QLB7_RHIMU